MLLLAVRRNLPALTTTTIKLDRRARLRACRSSLPRASALSLHKQRLAPERPTSSAQKCFDRERGEKRERSSSRLARAPNTNS